MKKMIMMRYGGIENRVDDAALMRRISVLINDVAYKSCIGRGCGECYHLTRGGVPVKEFISEGTSCPVTNVATKSEQGFFTLGVIRPSGGCPNETKLDDCTCCPHNIHRIINNTDCILNLIWNTIEGLSVRDAITALDRLDMEIFGRNV